MKRSLILIKKKRNLVKFNLLHKTSQGFKYLYSFLLCVKDILPGKPLIALKLCYFSVLGVGIFQAILYVSAPLSFIKAGISVLQLIAACNNIAVIDQSDREARKAK